MVRRYVSGAIGRTGASERRPRNCSRKDSVLNHIQETIDWLNGKGREFDKKADEAESQVSDLREKAACMRRVAELLGEIDLEPGEIQEEFTEPSEGCPVREYDGAQRPIVGPGQPTHNAAGRRIAFTVKRKDSSNEQEESQGA